MTPKQYNDMPEGDTKLAVRLAVTCGWNVSFDSVQDYLIVFNNDHDEFSPFVVFHDWNPFADPSIPYGLIGRGVKTVDAYPDGLFGATNMHGVWYGGRFKTHAIINAFCAADPLGHWARFMKGGEA